MERAPFSTIERLATSIYTENPALCHGDPLANEALIKHNFGATYGFTPTQVDEMDCIDAMLLKTIVETQLHVLKVKQKAQEAKGKSMLPEGLPFPQGMMQNETEGNRNP